MREFDRETEHVECSILVPVFNEERHIEQAVQSMRRQELAGQLEVLLIDGASTDGTREILARLAHDDPRIRLLENPRRSTPVGLNIGLRHARGRWVARMDAHSEYPVDYLERATERLSRGDTPWVSGPMIPVGGNAVSRAVALALATPLGRGGGRRWRAGGPADDEEYELDSGVFCGVWSRDSLLEVGGWDERWLRNQDSEMAGRFLGRGERLVCLPALAARYVPRRSISSLWRQYLEYGQFRVKTARRHPHTLRRSSLLAPALVLVTASALPRWRARRLAAPIVGVYAVALAAASVMALREAEQTLDALLVPTVLATMHAGHGLGFWLGVRRHGLPLSALGFAAGFRSAAPTLGESTESVCSPSLHDQSADEQDLGLACRRPE